MKRKIWTVSLMILLCLVLLPTVSAAEPDTAEMTNEELFAGYVEQVFYGQSDLNLFSVGKDSAGAKLTGNTKKYYDILVQQIKKIANGEEEIAIVSIGKPYSGADVIASLEGHAGENYDLDLLMDALLADCAYELYWYDKVQGVQTWYTEDWVEFYFYVAMDYRAPDTDFCVNTSKTGAAMTAAANARAIVADNADKSDYEKLLTYKNEICSLVDYNDDAARWDYLGGYGDPWQMIHVFDGDPKTKVVCEGYSKAFQYLCDQSTFDGDIACYSVMGWMDGGAHMWNIVTMENGENYLVDVTNSDTGTIGDGGELFLVGSAPYLGTAIESIYDNSGNLVEKVYHTVPQYVIFASNRNIFYVIGSDTWKLWRTGAVDGDNIWPSAGILKLAESKYTPPVCSHSYQWGTDTVQHWKECSKCHNVISKANHAFTGTEDKSHPATTATCTERATYYKKCECGIFSTTETFFDPNEPMAEHQYRVFGWDATKHFPQCDVCGKKDTANGTLHSGDPCNVCSYSKNGAAIKIDGFVQEGNAIKVRFYGSQLTGKNVVFAAASYDSKNKLIDIGFSQVVTGMVNHVPGKLDANVPTITGLKTDGAAKIVIFPIDQDGFNPLGKQFGPTK